MKNLTWQNPEQLFVAQVLKNRVKSKCCGIKDIVNMVYTGGFIMLSGFGLYYSIEKNGFGNYFRRRVFRLLIPFWLISLPFYTILFFRGEMSFLDVFYELTTIGTWINGNTYGMWYIAAAVLSYFIFPISYKIVKTKWPIMSFPRKS